MSVLTNALKDLINETIEENPTINTLKTDVASLKELVLYRGVMMEEMKHNIQLILEAVVPAQQRAALVDDVVAKVDDH